MKDTKSKVKHFFLNRQNCLEEVSIVEESTHKRRIQFSDGKQRNIHPEGVAWGRNYPRLFSSVKKPNHIFSYKGRSIAQMQFDENHYRIPEIDPSYRFQPFTSLIIDSINSKENILLSGGTGTGKTTSLLQIAAHIKQPTIRINLNGETRLSDLLGKVQVVDGATVFEYGVLPTAMKEGLWLILDEIDFAEASCLAILHPVLEDNPVLVLKENAGEVIRPHPNFRIFATANSVGAMGDRADSYDGTQKLNDAFIDRWQVVYVPNLQEKEEILMLRKRFPTIPLHHARSMVKFANSVRKDRNSGQFSTFTFSDNFSTRTVISWAKKCKLYRDPIHAAKVAWLDKMPLSEQPALIEVLNTFFSRRTRKKSISAGGFTLSKTSPQSIAQSFGSIRGRGRPKKVKSVLGS